MRTTEQWFKQSPAPVVGRIVTSVDDLRMIARSAAIYQKGTLVVMPIDSLDQLIKSIQKP